ncbi:hypothetical protein HHK36_031616 [Tetracentron sinense]|uniref:Uncharacterized protein n=1 Tax=Tetracentron sinense TaxID=13715 RepID=A0A834Y8R9_TETSI|nr:hypothetical protein HHK36_031616 [Tetracentron sinense]
MLRSSSSSPAKLLQFRISVSTSPSLSLLFSCLPSTPLSLRLFSELEKMSDSKVLIFGSFSEDEIRSLQKQSSGNSIWPSEFKDLQFGSLDFATVRSLGGFNGAPSRQPDSSKGFQPSKLVKDNAVKNAKTADNVLPRASGTVKEDGRINNSSHCVPLCTGQSTSPKLHDLESGISIDGNLAILPNSFPDETVVDSLAVVASKEDIQMAPSVAALLSCSPFVQLLHELRIRNIPRQEDAQEFLSFIMDQMHDELLKLKWRKIELVATITHRKGPSKGAYTVITGTLLGMDEAVKCWAHARLGQLWGRPGPTFTRVRAELKEAGEGRGRWRLLCIGLSLVCYFGILASEMWIQLACESLDQEQYSNVPSRESQTGFARRTM